MGVGTGGQGVSEIGIAVWKYEEGKRREEKRSEEMKYWQINWRETRRQRRRLTPTTSSTRLARLNPQPPSSLATMELVLRASE